MTNGRHPAFYLDNGFPQDRIVRPPFIDPTFANGGNVARGGAGWTDAAALPELVGDVPAPADRQHDAGRVVHRQPRQPPEPPLPDAGRGRQHERPERAGARRERPAVEHQLGGRAGGRHHARRMPGFNGNVAQALRQYPQYQNIQWRGVPDRRESVPRARSWSSSGASRAVSSSASATPTPGCTTTAPRARRATTASTARVQNPADPLEWSLSADDTPHVFLTGFTWEVPGRRDFTGVAEGAARRLERRAASCDTKADGRSTSR